MPFCPNCGSEVQEGARFCSHCGYQFPVIEEGRVAPIAPVPKTDAMSALQKGINIISAKPTVLVPALLGAVISAVLSSIAQWWFMPLGFASWWAWGYLGPGAMGLIVIALLLSLVGAIVAYILGFASLDMSRNAYLNRELSLSSSVNYVLSRLLTFILASIIGAILAITIILIPVVILMFVIIVVDETRIGDAISKAFKVLTGRLGDIILLVIIAIVGGFVFGLIPIVGSIIAACFNVLVALAFVDIYFNYRKAATG